MDALEGKGPQKGAQKRLDRRLQSGLGVVTVGDKLALGVRVLIHSFWLDGWIEFNGPPARTPLWRPSNLHWRVGHF